MSTKKEEEEENITFIVDPHVFEESGRIKIGDVDLGRVVAHRNIMRCLGLSDQINIVYDVARPHRYHEDLLVVLLTFSTRIQAVYGVENGGIVGAERHPVNGPEVGRGRLVDEVAFQVEALNSIVFAVGHAQQVLGLMER